MISLIAWRIKVKENRSKTYGVKLGDSVGSSVAVIDRESIRNVRRRFEEKNDVHTVLTSLCWDFSTVEVIDKEERKQECVRCDAK